ncbi:hypothetical protein EJ110_NYTH56450 [Nymphaea thermarum]|nr:hypothetical protein EJ110_NYTH56450 [Nymphaea thermarum]
MANGSLEKFTNTTDNRAIDTVKSLGLTKFKLPRHKEETANNNQEQQTGRCWVVTKEGSSEVRRQISMSFMGKKRTAATDTHQTTTYNKGGLRQQQWSTKWGATVSADRWTMLGADRC